jgi:copper chaperone
MAIFKLFLRSYVMTRVHWNIVGCFGNPPGWTDDPPGMLTMLMRYRHWIHVSKGFSVTEKTFKVPDVSCEHCVAAIKGELTKIDGVETVDVDIPSKMVVVTHDGNVSDERLVAGLDEAGYDIAP